MLPLSWQAAPEARELIDQDAWPEKWRDNPPASIRIIKYAYDFTRAGSPDAAKVLSLLSLLVQN